MLRTSGRDSIPLPGARVILHRLGRGAQGPVDSVLADRSGRFRFRFRPDTSAVYLLSARYAGIEYFSPPVHLNPERPDTLLAIVVSDTSSRAPVELVGRHLVVGSARRDGSRPALELLVLRNRSDRTRVAPDSTTPTWAVSLPVGSIGLEVQQGDYSPDAVVRRGGRLALMAAVAPGEKQIVVEYVLPAGLDRVEVPMEQGAEAVNVLVADPGARVEGPGLAPADTQRIEGRTYRHWSGAVPAGATIRIRLPRAGPVPEWLLPAMVAALAAALLGAAGWAALRGRATRPGRTPAGATRPAPALAGAPGPPPAPAADALVTRLAELDLRYAGRRAEVAPEEWAGYEAERARLKAELAAALAGPPRPA